MSMSLEVTFPQQKSKMVLKSNKSRKISLPQWQRNTFLELHYRLKTSGFTVKFKVKDRQIDRVDKKKFPLN